MQATEIPWLWAGLLAYFVATDRKRTRLDYSHGDSLYAVCCQKDNTQSMEI